MRRFFDNKSGGEYRIGPNPEKEALEGGKRRKKRERDWGSGWGGKGESWKDDDSSGQEDEEWEGGGKWNESNKWAKWNDKSAGSGNGWNEWGKK